MQPYGFLADEFPQPAILEIESDGPAMAAGPFLLKGKPFQERTAKAVSILESDLYK